MFVTTKRFNWVMENREREIKALNDRYWELLRKHSILLAHLGLTEVELPARTELRIKGGPERGSHE